MTTVEIASHPLSDADHRAQLRRAVIASTKQSVVVGLSVLALAACTPQPSPQMGAGPQSIIPGAYAAGSPGNTTGRPPTVFL
jgi:hypothetical protein